MQLDRFDIALITALESAGRISWRELAERVNLSASACQRRVNALQDKGVIRHFTLACHYGKLGYAVRAFVQVKVARNDSTVIQQFKTAVLAYSEVLACHKITGNVDFILDVVERDLLSFGQFIENRILYLPGVIDATSAIVLEQLKEHGQPVR